MKAGVKGRGGGRYDNKEGRGGGEQRGVLIVGGKRVEGKGRWGNVGEGREKGGKKKVASEVTLLRFC